VVNYGRAKQEANDEANKMSWGKVIFVSKRGGWIVVQHEDDDDATVVELIGDEGEIEIGDRLQGNWGADGGGETLFSENLNREISTFFQGRFGHARPAIDSAEKCSGDKPF
jgi:hypothetical protein